VLETLSSSAAPPVVLNTTLCCNCCNRPGCCGKYLKEYFIPPLHYLYILAYLILYILTLNISCSGNIYSPVYKMNLELDPAMVTGAYCGVTGSAVVAMLLIRRRRDVSTSAQTSAHANTSAQHNLTTVAVLKKLLKKSLQKSTPLILIYLLLAPPLFFVGRVCIYPLMYLDWETPDASTADDDYNAQTHTFYGKDGSKLLGYSIDLTPQHCQGETVLNRIPVIFYGGNGGYMYTNPYSSLDFLHHRLYDTDLDCGYVYASYSFSYRGYYPNDGDGLWGDEGNIVDDSVQFYEYVKSRHVNQKIVVLSHSLGTGPAAAVAAVAEPSDVACVVLGMPFNKMSQVVSELSYYSAYIYLWVVDKWDSNERIRGMNEDIPLLVLSARYDELIAPHHQQMLFDSAKSKDKVILRNEYGHHMSIYDTLWWYGNDVVYVDWWERGCGVNQ
jgi:hypothetical protein